MNNIKIAAVFLVFIVLLELTGPAMSGRTKKPKKKKGGKGGKVTDRPKLPGGIQLNDDNLISVLSDFIRAVDTLKGKVASLESSLEPLEEKVAKIEISLKRAIAFSVYMNVGLYTSTQSQENIPFGGVIYSDGHFNNDTRTYTCPYHGFYFFTYSLYTSIQDDSTTSNKESAWGHLYVNNNKINEAYVATNTPESMGAIAVNSAVVFCGQGTEVNVRTFGKTQLIGTPDSRRTTFTGFLVTTA